jgi:uncharacterized protein
MAHVAVHRDDLALDTPVLVEGLPGVGLVGKLAADHLVDSLDLAYYGHVECPGLPDVAAYHADETGVLPPVRLYADADRDLVVLQSDVPISPTEVSEFATCLTGWVDDADALPVYSTGLPRDVADGGDRAVYGVATGDAATHLDGLQVTPPAENGVWRGPTGALLRRADGHDLDAIGVIVETHRNRPDPDAARILLERVVAPIADVAIDVAPLREHAAEIRNQQQQFAEQMGHPDDDESSMAERSPAFQ